MKLRNLFEMDEGLRQLERAYLAGDDSLAFKYYVALVRSGQNEVEALRHVVSMSRTVALKVAKVAGDKYIKRIESAIDMYLDGAAGADMAQWYSKMCGVIGRMARATGDIGAINAANRTPKLPVIESPQLTALLWSAQGFRLFIRSMDVNELIVERGHDALPDNIKESEQYLETLEFMPDFWSVAGEPLLSVDEILRVLNR